jgi:hypothetical protein
MGWEKGALKEGGRKKNKQIQSKKTNKTKSEDKA